MRWKVRCTTTILFGLLFLFPLSGCSCSYSFQISGVVTDQDTGKPLDGVSVTLQAEDIRRQSPFPVFTDAVGKYSADFRIGDIEFMHGNLPKWTLVISKDGYQDATLDVSPQKRPESFGTTTQIIANCQLRAK